MHQKLFWIILGIFLLILTWINSQIFSHISWGDFIVNWNYEFTKIMFFNTLFPLFFIVLLLLWYFWKFKNQIPKAIYYSLIFIYIIIICSTYFSAILFQSLFWWVGKWHWLIFWNNLILFFLSMYIFFKNIPEKYILGSMYISAIFLSIYWLYEFYFPSFEYWDLWNRLLAPFWHPNYIAWILLMIIPYSIELLRNSFNLISIFKISKDLFLDNILQKILSIGITLLLIYTLLLTKSVIAIFICISYIFYISFWENNKKYYFYFLTWVIIIGWFLIFKYYPEKLSSFISRFYIWETTLKIIFSDIKIFIFWIWAENLILYFNNFKVPELYLYENIGFNADRPHNIFLNFWVHFWVFWFLFISYISYKIIYGFSSKNWWSYSLIGSLLFWSFNFPNIIGYLFFIIIYCFSLTRNTNNISYTVWIIKNKVSILLIIILFTISIIWSYYSYRIYSAEILVNQDKYTEALDVFPYNSDYYYNSYKLDEWLKIENNFYSENYYLYNIYFSFEKIESCEVLVKYYPSVENYFYCGEIIENKFWLEKAKYFYEKWIKKFPDVWNKQSKYLQKFSWKYIINTWRILHPKFSNIKEILEKLQ